MVSVSIPCSCCSRGCNLVFRERSALNDAPGVDAWPRTDRGKKLLHGRSKGHCSIAPHRTAHSQAVAAMLGGEGPIFSGCDNQLPTDQQQFRLTKKRHFITSCMIQSWEFFRELPKSAASPPAGALQKERILSLNSGPLSIRPICSPYRFKARSGMLCRVSHGPFPGNRGLNAISSPKRRWMFRRCHDPYSGPQ